MSATPWLPGPTAGSTAPALRPEPRTARLVQFCCQRLVGVEGEFAIAFRDELRRLTPGVPLLSTRSGDDFAYALAHCVLWAALTRDPVDVVEETVRAFAADQQGRGFADIAYAALGHALLRAARVTFPAGWNAELSSGLVSYALWLQPHLELGARCGEPPPGDAPSRQHLMSLDLILDHLRRYFSGQDRALNSVCTRVMLRTGADLRAPRPEQRFDPVVINEVLECLLLMGFAPASAAVGSVPAAVGSVPAAAGPVPAAAGPESGSAPVAGSSPAAVPQAAARRGPWWRKRRRK